MNIRKTNPNCLMLIEQKIGFPNELQKGFEGFYEMDSKFDSDVAKMNDNPKVMRISESVMNNARLIDDSFLKKELIIKEFDFDSLVIMLPSDKQGMIKFNRKGLDFSYLYYTDLSGRYLGDDELFLVNTYSFLTKGFLLDLSRKESLFPIQLIIYLFFGDITSKDLTPKSKTKISQFKTISNNSKLNITYVDSLWTQRISTSGFKVQGHFRLQPYGENRAERKLIWIEEFSKEGYNRKATRERK